MKAAVDLSKEYGLVLEGGGARGAYQIGVWKALREAGVKIKGVAGASVGALNGALVCMDDLERAEKIWNTITYSKVMDVNEDVIGSLMKRDVKNLNLQALIAEAKKLLQEKGFDIAPLRALIAETVDEEKIRNSPCEFYATTLSITDRKELCVDMKQVPEGTIGDMLLASAYFPAFKNEKLGGKTYMDGGSVNNVPVNLLTDRGYKDIIVIRIYGVGLDREWTFDIPEDVTLYRIAPKKSLGGVLEFDERKAKRNMRLGYYDGLRFLHGLSGRRYYLYMPYGEPYYFDKMMSELVLLRSFLEPVMPEQELEKLNGYRAYTEQIFPALALKMKLQPHWDYRDLYAGILEACARKMRLEPFAVYTPEEIIGRVGKALGESAGMLSLEAGPLKAVTLCEKEPAGGPGPRGAGAGGRAGEAPEAGGAV